MAGSGFKFLYQWLYPFVSIGRNTFTLTVRRPERMGQVVEVKTPLSKKDYDNMLNHADSRHLPVFKTRRCFLYNNQQYQLDIYR